MGFSQSRSSPASSCWSAMKSPSMQRVAPRSATLGNWCARRTAHRAEPASFLVLADALPPLRPEGATRRRAAATRHDSRARRFRAIRSALDRRSSTASRSTSARTSIRSASSRVRSPHFTSHARAHSRARARASSWNSRSRSLSRVADGAPRRRACRPSISTESAGCPSAPSTSTSTARQPSRRHGAGPPARVIRSCARSAGKRSRSVARRTMAALRLATGDYGHPLTVSVETAPAEAARSSSHRAVDAEAADRRARCRRLHRTYQSGGARILRARERLRLRRSQRGRALAAQPVRAVHAGRRPSAGAALRLQRTSAGRAGQPADAGHRAGAGSRCRSRSSGSTGAARLEPSYRCATRPSACGRPGSSSSSGPLTRRRATGSAARCIAFARG